MISPKDAVRHRFTPQQRQRLLTRFHKGQLNQRDFAARHGVGLSTLSKWLRLERAADEPSVEFRELVMPTAGAKWAVEITSPKGWTVRLQDSSAIRTLPKVLRALC